MRISGGRAWGRAVVMLSLLLSLSLSLLATPARAQARSADEPRLALVIVNGGYQFFDKLASTYADGEKIATALNATLILCPDPFAPPRSPQPPFPIYQPGCAANGFLCNLCPLCL